MSRGGRTRPEVATQRQREPADPATAAPQKGPKLELGLDLSPPDWPVSRHGLPPRRHCRSLPPTSAAPRLACGEAAGGHRQVRERTARSCGASMWPIPAPREPADHWEWNPGHKVPGHEETGGGTWLRRRDIHATEGQKVRLVAQRETARFWVTISPPLKASASQRNRQGCCHSKLIPSFLL